MCTNLLQSQRKGRKQIYSESRAYRPFSRVMIRTCAETNSSRETTPLGGIAECGMSDYYKKLDSIAKARYLEKLKLLGLDEKDDPHDPINVLWMT